MRVLFATGNRGKLAELRALVAAAGLDVEIASLADFPHLPEVDEDQPTFAGNALKKARAGAAATGLPTIADDSGLEVDALDGAPGVRSARFAADDNDGTAAHDDGANNRKLLRLLAGVPRRTARFHCALVYAAPDGATLEAHGTVEGHIGDAPRGSGGFGYDPLFIVDELGGARTMAELTSDEKNRISHRGRAMAALVERLRGELARHRTS